jgi:hypothetical protein
MKFIFLSICITLALSYPDDYFNSMKYFSLPRNTKMEQLWGRITQFKSGADWYGHMETLKVLIEDLEPTFEHEGDVMPEGRHKYIHTVGGVAKAKFVAIKNTPYTGILKGSSDIIVRFSTAKSYVTEGKKYAGDAYGNFVPGISLKFLRDGIPSTNLVAMKTVMGSSSWNFFEDDLTNNFVIPEKVDGPLQLISRRFKMLTPHISALGLWEMCSKDEEGQDVENPVFPFRLIFKAPKEIKNRFTSHYTEDYLKQLSTIEPDTIIYHVYAQQTPDCNEEKIGELVLESNITLSSFADLGLFFRHTWLGHDIKAHTDWYPYYDEMGWFGSKGVKKVAKKSCPFANIFH